ncbi:MAG: hypothetical protein J0M25_08190 [Flavobacteriales bacterium]|nr:hypothetical protein [Flavobacteriales bacterium]
MKKIINIFYVAVLTSMFVSCEQNDRISGSPEQNDDIVTLTGVISSSEASVVAGQTISFTATIPQTFEGDVDVEATAILPNGVKTTSFVTIPAGQTTATGEIEVPASEAPVLMPFNNNMKLFLSAILLSVGEEGTHYLLNSNELSLDFGDSETPAANITRLQVRFDWKGPYGEAENDLDLYLLRLNPDNSLTVVGTGFTGTRYENGAILNTAVDGTYIVAAESYTLTYGSELGSLPYRYVLRYPDNSVKTFAGTFTDFTEGDFVEVLQIVKTTVDGVVSYNVTQL